MLRRVVPVVLLLLGIVASTAAVGCGQSEADKRAEAAAREQEAEERRAEAERRRREEAAARRRIARARAYAACSRTTGDLADALQELDSRLSVGLNYENYGTAVADARVAYDRMDIARLVEYPGCLGGVAARLEAALNQHIRAAGKWTDCVGDWECDFDSITPELQAQWARAGRAVDAAEAKLGSLSP